MYKKLLFLLIITIIFSSCSVDAEDKQPLAESFEKMRAANGVQFTQYSDWKKDSSMLSGGEGTVWLIKNPYTKRVDSSRKIYENSEIPQETVIKNYQIFADDILTIAVEANNEINKKDFYNEYAKKLVYLNSIEIDCLVDMIESDIDLFKMNKKKSNEETITYEGSITKDTANEIFQKYFEDTDYMIEEVDYVNSIVYFLQNSSNSSVDISLDASTYLIKEISLNMYIDTINDEPQLNIYNSMKFIDYDLQSIDEI